MKHIETQIEYEKRTGAVSVSENIKNMYRVYVVALPDSLDDKILPAFVPVFCMDGTVTFSNGVTRRWTAYDAIKEALTPEWAEAHIIGYVPGMHLSYVSGYSLKYNVEADKLDEKIQKKLERMTVKDYYRKGVY